MTPIEYLQELFESVSSALGETLRQDYGPDVSSEYYEECESRLLAIKKDISSTKPNDLLKISAQLSQLNNLSNWICLIERSQLGAFSWPFAFALRKMSISLLSEDDFKGVTQKPIVHIVADGTGYLINYEPRVPPASARRKFVVISFPRSLKHHVLLHTIFGHELGHAALFTTSSGPELLSGVLSPLAGSKNLVDANALTSWLHDAAAPAEVKAQLAAYKAQTGADFRFTDEYYESWLIELFCDMFGLVLFGPSFLAAHRAILQPLDSSSYECNLASATHPPYAVRHRLMVECFKVLGWDNAVIDPANASLHGAERRFLNYLTNDNSSAWAGIVEAQAVKDAVTSLRAFFDKRLDTAYSPPTSSDLSYLINRLVSRLPPIQEEISEAGVPTFKATHISHSMYAGWIYWIDRQNLSQQSLGFTVTNRLCDQGLLQQEAINKVFYPDLVS